MHLYTEYVIRFCCDVGLSLNTIDVVHRALCAFHTVNARKHRQEPVTGATVARAVYRSTGLSQNSGLAHRCIRATPDHIPDM